MCDICDPKELKRRVEVEIRRGKPLDVETYDAVMKWVSKPYPPVCGACGKPDGDESRPCLYVNVGNIEAIRRLPRTWLRFPKRS